MAAVSFWDPANAASAPARFGFDYVTATPSSAVCSSNAAIEGMVARAFWDLDDSTSEAGAAPAAIADSYNATSTFIAQGWDEFANGTGNHDDGESDRDGVNLQDYYFNNSARFVSVNLDDTLLDHNCMASQTSL